MNSHGVLVGIPKLPGVPKGDVIGKSQIARDDARIIETEGRNSHDRFRREFRGQLAQGRAEFPLHREVGLVRHEQGNGFSASGKRLDRQIQQRPIAQDDGIIIPIRRRHGLATWRCDRNVIVRARHQSILITVPEKFNTRIG